MMGIGKYYIISPKFISADGGFKRVVWMSSFLKDSMADEFRAVAEREGVPDLIDRIADERNVTTVDELVTWLKENAHPVLEMGPMQAASGVPEGEAAVEKAAAAETTVVEQAPPAKPAAVKEPEPVVTAPVEAKPAPAAQATPAAAPVAPSAANAASTDAVVQATAEVVLGSIRRALEAALVELGGTAPAAPAVPAAIPATEATPTAPAVVEAPALAQIERPTVPPWTEEQENIDFVKETWAGTVREVTLGATADDGGTRTTTITVGGQTAMPFLDFEGSLPHRPVLAVEIQDRKPDDWSPLLMEVWGDAMSDPAGWAKAAEQAGAGIIALQLSLTDADGNPNTPENAKAVVGEVLEATGLPLIVLGPGQVDADNELLVPVAEAAAGERLVLGICEEKNYRTIVAAALANNHLVIARTAMDVNLAKQLNILISDMGLPPERILMDPTCAGVGYGMEYGYSVMERLRLAALQGDSMTQMPMIVTVGYEAWRQKETKVGEGVPEAWGEWKERAINWETLTAATLVESAADIVVLRHPESVRRVQAMIDELMDEA
jgi:acetyl-CoA decarbonylase/synthase complex subunit delta